MVPLKWYTVELQMIENKKGNLNVMFRNHIYAKDKQHTTTTTGWRCTRKNHACLARITTRGHNQLKIGIRPHNHPSMVPSQKRKKFQKLKNPLAEMLEIKCEPVEFID
uniref:(northern house mosquito) hypothetical protein n=1 Tax=Culex pipiens TaxID=7175 RepID=A0A8D8BDJ8_CULPI